MKRGDRSGFTLIELVIVIVLLGILAAIALPIFRNLRKDAVRATANGELAALRAAANVYAANEVAKGRDLAYPATKTLLEAEIQYPLEVLKKTIEGTTWNYTYSNTTGKVQKSGW